MNVVAYLIIKVALEANSKRVLITRHLIIHLNLIWRKNKYYMRIIHIYIYI